MGDKTFSQFWQLRFSEAESIDSFVTELRCKAQDYESGAAEDIMIRDNIVFSITDNKLQEKLLEHADLALTEAIEMSRVQTLAYAQVLAVAAEASVTLTAVAQKQKQKQPRHTVTKFPSNTPAQKIVHLPSDPLARGVAPITSKPALLLALLQM